MDPPLMSQSKIFISKLFFFQKPFKKRGLRLLKEKQLVRCNEKITGELGL